MILYPHVSEMIYYCKHKELFTQYSTNYLQPNGVIALSVWFRDNHPRWVSRSRDTTTTHTLIVNRRETGVETLLNNPYTKFYPHQPFACTPPLVKTPQLPHIFITSLARKWALQCLRMQRTRWNSYTLCVFGVPPIGTLPLSLPLSPPPSSSHRCLVW